MMKNVADKSAVHQRKNLKVSGLTPGQSNLNFNTKTIIVITKQKIIKLNLKSVILAAVF